MSDVLSYIKKLRSMTDLGPPLFSPSHTLTVSYFSFCVLFSWCIACATSMDPRASKLFSHTKSTWYIYACCTHCCLLKFSYITPQLLYRHWFPVAAHISLKHRNAHACLRSQKQTRPHLRDTRAAWLNPPQLKTQVLLVFKRQTNR